MAYKKKNGDLDMRYNSSKEKAKKRHMREVIFVIFAILFLSIFGTCVGE